jgi:thiol-disulfide isomerase/thioredoxin
LFQRVVRAAGTDYPPGMRNRTALAFAALGLVLLGGCQRKAAEQQQQQQAEAPEGAEKGVSRAHAGEAMPDAQLFNASDDKTTLSEAAGKPLLVNLWASWCAPCVKELPTLDALSRQPGAPRILAVSEDIGERPSVEAFLQSHGIKDLETWRDPKMALSGALHVQVMPTTVFYDASGKEIWRYTGDLDWTSAEAAKLLAEGGKAAAR